MSKEQTKRIKNWEELITLVDNINPFKNTIVLSGYVNYIDGDRIKISEMMFTIRPVDIVAKKVKKHGKRVVK